jgi:hypothetical protein
MRPHVIAVPATAVVAGLASTALHLGLAGIVGGLILGAVWTSLLGLITAQVQARERWRTWAANAPVFAGIVASGVMVGGGLMYGLLMNAAAGASPEVLSAMMQPTIPFFIVLNTPLEWLVVPGALFSNWHVPSRRRLLVVAAAVYYVMRVWTYLFYAGTRMEIAAAPLSAEALGWFLRTMNVDYRGVLNAVVHALFIAAAFVPASSSEHRER